MTGSKDRASAVADEVFDCATIGEDRQGGHVWVERDNSEATEIVARALREEQRRTLNAVLGSLPRTIIGQSGADMKNRVKNKLRKMIAELESQ